MSDAPLGPDNNTDIRSLLARLQEVQRERAEEYNGLHASFQQLLLDQNAQAYRRRLEQATKSFQHSSSKVRAIIQSLRSCQKHPELLELLQQLQTKEQAKLKFTLIVQALRSAEAEGGFSWQQPVSQAASKGAPAASGEQGHGCHASVEPTEVEYKNALREATQELQKSVAEINEVLEEAHYLLEEE